MSSATTQTQMQMQQPTSSQQAQDAAPRASPAVNSAPSSPTRPRSVSVKHVRVEADADAHKRPSRTAAAGATSTTGAAAAAKSQSSARVSHINVGDERLHLALIQLLGCVLAQLVSFEEQQYPGGRGSISMFHTAYVPSISIGAYLRRVALYTKVSSEVLLQSVLHVHQLMQRSVQPLIVNSLNVHRLLLTSILTTAKFFDDAHYNNSYFSYVGGVPLRELNALEVEFLSLLNFDFFVHTSTYQFFYSMCKERSIHLGGCACPSHLEHVPDTVPVLEYKPDPEVDFSMPIEPQVPVDARLEAATVIAGAEHKLGSMRALDDAIRVIASTTAAAAASASSSHSLDESLGDTDTDESQSSSALTTPAQRHAHSNSHSRCHSSSGSSSHVRSQSHVLASGSSKTPRQQQLQVNHYTSTAPSSQQQQQQSHPRSPASYTSSCFPGADSPVSSVSSFSSLSTSYHSRAHHAPSATALVHMQSPSTSRSYSTSLSLSTSGAQGRVTATATPRAARTADHSRCASMQVTPRASYLHGTPTPMQVEACMRATKFVATPLSAAAVPDDKHAQLDLTPRMSVVPQEP